jgi:hypothetical protein
LCMETWRKMENLEWMAQLMESFYEIFSRLVRILWL